MPVHTKHNNDKDIALKIVLNMAYLTNWKCMDLITLNETENLK